MSGALATATIRDSAALARLEPAWRELLQRCPTATPFQAPAWLLPWWEAFHPGEVCAVAVHAGERLVALAPLYLERSDAHRRLLPIGISLSDYHDVLADAAFEDVALAALARHVRLAEDWDEWILPELALAAAARRLPWPAGAETEQPASPCPVLALASGGPDAAVPARQRRKLRMARHRVGRRGVWRILETNALPPKRWLDELQRLHDARWGTRGETGVLADDAVRRFHALALPRLCAHGLARLFALEIDGRVVGVTYGFHFAGRAYAYLGGFDPQFESVSPGRILLGHAIEKAHWEGACTFDFLRGAEAYKYRWGARDRCNVTRLLRRGVS